MSRKTPDSHRGFNDVIGIALLAAALLLLVAQFSFDRYDLSFVSSTPHNHAHNWIGSLGAYTAYAFFFVFGLTAYIFPFLLAAFGVGYVCNFLSHLRERKLWFGFWSVILIFSLSGLLDMMDGMLKSLRDHIDVASAGGLLGKTLFDFKLFGDDWGFWVLGSI
ncbi:MAG TPA: DNA translocase FtsK 4TM domain-containing protein, partial [Verrucomicrobiae bacterium]|nr:DNA translocase FtsK 4TM domain-containing protein [Verrucomicrobiae bacterium]